MAINWFDKRVMPLMQYDITMQITHNDKNTDKYKLRLFFRHGLENQITSNGLIKIGIDPDRDRMYFAQADRKYYGYRYKYARGCCLLETSSRMFEALQKYAGHYMAEVDEENGLIYISYKKVIKRGAKDKDD